MNPSTLHPTLGTSVAVSTPSDAISRFQTHLKAAEANYMEVEAGKENSFAHLQNELVLAYAECAEVLKASGGKAPPSLYPQFALLFFLQGRQLENPIPLAASHYFLLSILLTPQNECVELLDSQFLAEILNAKDFKEQIRNLGTRHASGTLPKLDNWLEAHSNTRPTIQNASHRELFHIGSYWCHFGMCLSRLPAYQTAAALPNLKTIYIYAFEYLNAACNNGGANPPEEYYSAINTLAEMHFFLYHFICSLEAPQVKDWSIAYVKKSASWIQNSVSFRPSDDSRSREHAFWTRAVRDTAQLRAKNLTEKDLDLTENCFVFANNGFNSAKAWKESPPHFKPMSLHQKIEFAIDLHELGQKRTDLSIIQEWINDVRKYVESRTDKQPVFASFWCLVGRFERLCKRDTQALEYLKKAEAMLSQLPDTVKTSIKEELKAQIEALRQKIQQPEASPKSSPAPVVTPPSSTPPSAPTNLTATHKVTREWTEFAIAILIASAVSALFIAIGVAASAPLLITASTIGAMTGGLLLFRWHYQTPKGLNLQTHYAFAIAYPSALSVAAIAITIFSPIPATIFGALSLMTAGVAIFKGETASTAV